tara:strand:- start:191 stop:379 length:189 start_codon:yes stop_codon:yes gene_type:complete
MPYQKYCKESKTKGISNGVKIYLMIKPPIIKKTRYAIVLFLPISISKLDIFILSPFDVIKNE